MGFFKKRVTDKVLFDLQIKILTELLNCQKKFDEIEAKKQKTIKINKDTNKDYGGSFLSDDETRIFVNYKTSAFEQCKATIREMLK